MVDSLTNKRKPIQWMHMELHGLNAWHTSYYFIYYSSCDRCNAKWEDCKHYLLECSAYNEQCLEVIALLIDLLPQVQESILKLQLVSNRNMSRKIMILGLGVPEIVYVVAIFIYTS